MHYTRNSYVAYCQPHILSDKASQFKIVDSPHRPAEPRAEFLPSFQILVVALILATYRGIEGFPICIAAAQIAFQLFENAGVYDQTRINAQNGCPMIRESYQRYAMMPY